MRTLLLLVPLFLLPILAEGQQVDPFPPGTRLRVTLDAELDPVRVGAYHSATNETLALANGRGVQAIAWGDVRRLERSLGRRPKVAVGIAGLLLGGAVGGVSACHWNRDSYGVFCAGQSDTKLVVGAVLGSAIGGAAGALLFRRERWEPVEGVGARAR